ncbi:MAG: class I SAM-dependent methyltransferase [Bacteroidetes bacterium]|nr:class I SAM-dependent methyltransferase [Bacteroidota bacterium]MDA1120059.1 class I SAM-dependent methyltransferase [Bacteroidota bacterium]
MSEKSVPFEKTIPGVYERYLGPYLYEPYALYVTNKIKDRPKHVLEIGAGTGRLTNHLAKKIGLDAKLIAIDINPAMLDIARLKVNEPNVEFQVADAQYLSFPDNSFDFVVCQFGFMFLPEKQKGFNEAWRVLKPGGQFLFVTWDKAENNITLHISQQTILHLLKATPPPFFGRAYSSMNNPEELRSYAEVAGFENVTVQKITLEGQSPTAMDAAIGFVEGNAIIHEILKEGPELLQTIKTTIVARINEQVSNDPVHSELNAWVGEAFK